MAQPTIVGDSGKVNGKHAGASSGGRHPTQSASMKSRQPQRESTPGSRASRSTAAPRAEESTRPSKRPSAHPRRGGVPVPRRYTTAGVDPFDSIVWERRSSIISNADGSVVFKMDGAEIPSGWSQLATDIVVSKYFRKAGLYGKKEVGETSVRQVVYRLAHTIREAGEAAVGAPPPRRRPHPPTVHHGRRRSVRFHRLGAAQ